ncbi:MAG TPA: hypothetical protein VGJ82_13585 [Thermoanaerobaculia bacterium]
MSLSDYSISFGGFRIRVHDVRGENVRPHVSLEGPIAKYIVANDAPAHLDLTVETLKAPPIPGRTLLFDSGGVWRLFDDGDCYRIECRVYGDLYKIAFLSKDLTHGTVKMVPYDVTTPYPLQYPLDEVILNLLLPRHDAVELHGCGLVDRNGNGYLFAGNSGAGKTTTARLWQHDAAEILSDDRIVVRHEEGAWRMYGTPWHGEADICSPSHARLHRIFLLEQAAYNSIDPISTAAAVARMLSCTFPPFHDAGGLNAIAGTLADISAAVPVTRLSFVNDRSAVDFVREAFEVAA